LPSLITEGSVVLLAQSLRTHWRDPQVATAALEALLGIVTGGQHLQRVVEAFPVSQVIQVGEAHFADPRVAAPLNKIIAVMAGTSESHRIDLSKAGAVSIGARSLEENIHHAKTVEAASQAIKALATRSPEALGHVTRLSGIRVLFDALVVHRADATVVRSVLAALAAAGQDADGRVQLIDPENPDTGMLLEAIVRTASELATSDADILAQACCAVGTLTFVEEDALKGKQATMRRPVDLQQLEILCDAMRSAHGRSFAVDATYFQQLVNAAPKCDLSPPRLLSRSGAEVNQLRYKRPEDVLAEAQQGQLNTDALLNQKEDIDQVMAELSKYDVFEHLRGLGVGGASIASDSDDVVEDFKEKLDSERPGQGIIDGLLGGGAGRNSRRRSSRPRNEPRPSFIAGLLGAT